MMLKDRWLVLAGALYLKKLLDIASFAIHAKYTLFFNLQGFHLCTRLCKPLFSHAFLFCFFALFYFSAVEFCVWFSDFFSDLKRKEKKRKRSYREEPLKQRPSLGESPPRTLYQQKSESRILECTGISFEVFRGLTVEGCLEIQWSVLESLVVYLWNLHENSWLECLEVQQSVSKSLVLYLWNWHENSWVECSDVQSVLKSLGLY